MAAPSSEWIACSAALNGRRARPLNSVVWQHLNTVLEFTKRERAELRALAGDAYEWELGRELEALEKSFAAWRSGKLLSSELSAEIHEFHQHAGRELWSMYQSVPEHTLVVRAVALGAIAEERLSEHLREKLREAIDYFRKERQSAA